jgi:hypothetical protein
LGARFVRHNANAIADNAAPTTAMNNGRIWIRITWYEQKANSATEMIWSHPPQPAEGGVAEAAPFGSLVPDRDLAQFQGVAADMASHHTRP